MSDVERPRNVAVEFERTDASPMLIAILAGGLAAFVLIALIAIRFGVPDALRGLGPEPRPTAAPQLSADPPADYATHRATELRLLQGYHWIDRDRGIVRLPIEQAMHDVAGRGIKDWPEGAP